MGRLQRDRLAVVLRVVGRATHEGGSEEEGGGELHGKVVGVFPEDRGGQVRKLSPSEPEIEDFRPAEEPNRPRQGQGRDKR